MKIPYFFSFIIPVIILFIPVDLPTANRELAEKSIVSNKDTKGGALEFTDANFQSKVLSSDKLTIVDFWAEWCGPCRKMGPVIEDLAKEYGSKVNIGKLNVDHNPNVCMKYSITSIPTILFIKNGKVVDKLVGLNARNALVKKIEKHI